MSVKEGDCSRRAFLKATGAAGLGSILAPFGSTTRAYGSASNEVSFPMRPFGKTGQQVSILSLGGVLRASDLLVFRQAFKMGVTYWDTADSYGRGKNEEAIGKYLTKYPDDRKKIFLVTKAATSDPQKLTEKLNRSLQRMNTAYVDLYFIHYVKDVKKELTDEVKAWAEKQKSNGKIRFFGFSTHKNMENTLPAAAKLGWIDGIMMSYNYRLMVKDQMKRALEACVKAGIGLTAMKTQAAFSANFYSTIGSESDDALKTLEPFIDKGYSPEQVKLKAVWENPNIASICSAMPNLTILQANAAAAMDKQSLSRNDWHRLEKYACQTAPGYCTGCANICEGVVDLDIPISDMMRAAMYHQGYGDRDKAVRLFNQLGPNVMVNIRKANFLKAEKYCPQGMPIGDILRKTLSDLA